MSVLSSPNGSRHRATPTNVSSMSEELIANVLIRLPTVADLIAFRSTCHLILGVRGWHREWMNAHPNEMALQRMRDSFHSLDRESLSCCVVLANGIDASDGTDTSDGPAQMGQMQAPEFPAASGNGKVPSSRCQPQDKLTAAQVANRKANSQQLKLTAAQVASQRALIEHFAFIDSIKLEEAVVCKR